MVDDNPRDPHLQPDDAVAWTLVRTGRAAGDRFLRVFDRVGLTKHEFGVLVRLRITPGVSQAALAREVLVTPQSIGPILRQMTDRGLVRRTVSGGRGTAVAVELTDAGRRALLAATPHVAALNEPTALGLTPEDARLLNELLHRVHRHLTDDPPPEVGGRSGPEE